MLSRRQWLQGLGASIGFTGAAAYVVDRHEATVNGTAPVVSWLDPAVTTQFRQLAEVHPWLQDVRQSIGLMQATTADGKPYVGSCVYLGEGVATFCNHEYRGFTRLAVSTRADRKNKIPLDTTKVVANPHHDIAFIKLPREAWSQFKSIRWGRGEHALNKLDAKPVSVGFPYGWALHAVELDAPVDYKDLIMVKPMKIGDIPVYMCKDSLRNSIYGGMSGGGVFHKGCFTGLNNAITDPAAVEADKSIDRVTHITSVDVVKEAFIHLYPAKAVRLGLMSDGGDYIKRPACRFDKRNYLLPRRAKL